jgi:hypothetical protein
MTSPYCLLQKKLQKKREEMREGERRIDNQVMN